MSRDRLCVCGHTEHAGRCSGFMLVMDVGPSPNPDWLTEHPCGCPRRTPAEPAALTDCDPGDETPEIRAQPDAHEGVE